MEATVQMNTRMPRSLKEAGTAALAEIGFTPTKAINALWEKAAKRGKDLDEVAALLVEQPEPVRELAEDDPIITIRQMIDDFCDDYGIVLGPFPRDADLSEAIAEEMWERMEERCGA
ncbi:MAG: hypothetical protein IJ087_16050 [Eggerthellaceae bacterium]|nr:hypothetical protein [Eggerthellaceae bacterium]